ncbi:MAG: alpha/beta fold hydrolase [Rhodospirillaceae bacterium]|nr:alpha/beta fold hydrolase [Rhodospirillaceae bacterium]
MLLRGPADLPFPPFRERFPWFGADLQTLRNTLRRTTPSLAQYASQQLRFPCTDGSGDILLGTLNTPLHAGQKPLLVLVHGLTGSEDSSHILVSATYFLAQGYPTLRLNQRGAGPSRATCRGHYHAGRSDDLATVLSALPASLTPHGICVMAVSLGANMMLKCLAEYPRFPTLRAAVAVSPPVDLAASQRQIMQRRNWVYHRYLLQRMKDGADWAELIEKVSPDVLAGVHTIYDFDDKIVAPANDFADAPDYYRQCSALQFLDAIDTPTLIIHPQDDPWVPTTPLAKRNWDSHQPGHTHVSVLLPTHGGHIGLHGRGSAVPWHNLCADVFFTHTN